MILIIIPLPTTYFSCCGPLDFTKLLRSKHAALLSENYCVTEPIKQESHLIFCHYGVKATPKTVRKALLLVNGPARNTWMCYLPANKISLGISYKQLSERFFTVKLSISHYWFGLLLTNIISDLTLEALLTILRRFIACKEICLEKDLDYATNFVRPRISNDLIILLWSLRDCRKFIQVSQDTNIGGNIAYLGSILEVGSSDRGCP
ncbi:hypothetical protein M0802_011323 [Mischocyttarus mexicanus]|nr:hypothetical protein M0802_011323 [Mischocyttarus mexicanus]